MPSFNIVNPADFNFATTGCRELNADEGFKSYNKIYNKQGKEVTDPSTYEKKMYRIFEKGVREYHGCERFLRGALGCVATFFTLGGALCSKDVRNLFKECVSQRFAVPYTYVAPVEGPEAAAAAAQAAAEAAAQAAAEAAAQAAAEAAAQAAAEAAGANPAGANPDADAELTEAEIEELRQRVQALDLELHNLNEELVNVNGPLGLAPGHIQHLTEANNLDQEILNALQAQLANCKLQKDALEGLMNNNIVLFFDDEDNALVEQFIAASPGLGLKRADVQNLVQLSWGSHTEECQSMKEALNTAYNGLAAQLQNHPKFIAIQQRNAEIEEVNAEVEEYNQKRGVLMAQIDEKLQLRNTAANQLPVSLD